jgi:RNA polymerase sigma-70 factor (ECF subfamily)
VLRPETFVGQRRDALFEEQRPLLMGIAYRMLGTVRDADSVLDAVRREWRAGGQVRDPSTALIKAVTRLAMQRLDGLRAERNGSAGAWLPEPILGCGGPPDLSPHEGSLALDLLAALETLSPLERAAYVLRVALACPYPQVADALGRHEPAVRQLVHRSRAHLLACGLRLDTDDSQHAIVVRRLAEACRAISPGGLTALFVPAVVLHTDARAGSASGPRVTVGPERATGAILTVWRRLPRGAVTDVETVNGAAGVVVRIEGQPAVALAVRVDGGQVTAIQLVATPTKLHALGARELPTAIV